eukprot:3922316-Amphidinium_carterae.3
MSIQAEVGAIIQDSSQVKDVSRKAGASAQAADVPTNAAYLKKEDSGTRRCQYWGTKAGCKFGATCKFVHPYEKAGSGLFCNCGSTEHTSAECKRAQKGPLKGVHPIKGLDQIRVIGLGRLLQL